MYSKTNITLLRTNSWFSENGYLTIDLELFGQNLCALFNKFLGEYYYFQEFNPTIKTDKERPIWQQGRDARHLAIISPKLYDERSNQNYNKVRVVPISDFRPNYIMGFTSYSKEYPTLFEKEPLNLDEKDFLLYFGAYYFDHVKVYLGHVENNTFIPNAFDIPICENGINYSNPIYPFIKDFMSEIFYYKVLNKKPIIDQSDMEIILKSFGISREEKIQTIVKLLQAMNEESTKILLENNSVGNVLKLVKRD